MLFFLYYITVFCHVYQKTQLTLFYDILISFVFSFLVSLVLALAFSTIYLIACGEKIKVLYMFTILAYNYA